MTLLGTLASGGIELPGVPRRSYREFRGHEEEPFCPGYGYPRSLFHGVVTGFPAFGTQAGLVIHPDARTASPYRRARRVQQASSRGTAKPKGC